MCRRKLSAVMREVQALAVALPCRREDGPGEDLVLRLGRRERAKVVLTHEVQRGRGQGTLVDRARPPKRPGLLQR